MAERGTERRLAAVVAADVVGFSRLMERDEAGTLSRLKDLRSELIDPKIDQYRGRIVKLIGDGVLVEFPSVINSLACAVDIQRAMARREAEMPEDMRLALRVGINIGDIIVDQEDIYGTGVNVATRLEGIAESGGICVSERVVQQVEAQNDVGFEFLGPQKVKNIEKPVNAYKVVLDPARVGNSSTPAEAASSGLRHGRGFLIRATIACLLVGAAATFWFLKGTVDFQPASTSKMAYPLPKVPSVAVLPFKNISGSSEQEYFADAMTEDIVTDLSKVSGIFVVASKASLSYKGANTELGKIAEELGVRYLLDGSVQRGQKKIRISVRLIDAITRKHIWGERYDRDMKHLLAVQSEIAQKIAKALAVTLTANDIERLFQKRTGNIEAYDTFLNARVRWIHPAKPISKKGCSSFGVLSNSTRTLPAATRACHTSTTSRHASVMAAIEPSTRPRLLNLPIKP